MSKNWLKLLSLKFKDGSRDFKQIHDDTCVALKIILIFKNLLLPIVKIIYYFLYLASLTFLTMKIFYKCKKPINKNNKFIENFFIKKGLKPLVDLSKKKTFTKSNDPRWTIYSWIRQPL